MDASVRIKPPKSSEMDASVRIKLPKSSEMDASVRIKPPKSKRWRIQKELRTIYSDHVQLQERLDQGEKLDTEEINRLKMAKEQLKKLEEMTSDETFTPDTWMRKQKGKSNALIPEGFKLDEPLPEDKITFKWLCDVKKSLHFETKSQLISNTESAKSVSSISSKPVNVSFKSPSLSEIYEKSPQICFVPKNSSELRLGLTQYRCHSTPPTPRSVSCVRMATRDELKYQLDQITIKNEMLAKTMDKQKTELLFVKKDRDALKKQVMQNIKASEKAQQQIRDSEALLEVAEVARKVVEKEKFSVREELYSLKEHISSLTKKFDSLKKISRLWGIESKCAMSENEMKKGDSLKKVTQKMENYVPVQSRFEESADKGFVKTQSHQRLSTKFSL